MLRLPRENRLNSIFKKISEFPWIQILFSIGVVLRISGFTAARMWYDELFSLEITHQNLFEMINTLRTNISPPGWETLLWFVVRVFGWNAFSMRLPSVIASIITLWLVYIIGRTLMFTKGQLIVALAIVALLPYQLITAQMGRVYALFTLFYLLGIYAVLSKRWLVLGLSAATLLWLHNISFLYLPGLFIIALLVHPKNWKKIFLIFFLSALTILPWLGITLTHSMKSIPWFTTLTIDYFIIDLFVALFGFNFPPTILVIVFFDSLALCLLAAVLLPFARWIYRDMRKDLEAVKIKRMTIKNLFTDSVIKRIKEMVSFPQLQVKYILFLAFAVPFSLMTLFSLFRQNILIEQTTSILIIPIVMWLITIYVVPRPNIFHLIVWSISTFLMVAGLISWTPTRLDGNFANLKSIITWSFRKGYVLSPSHHFQPGDAFLHNSGDSALVFYYYFQDVPQYLIDGNDVFLRGDIQALKIPIIQAAPENIVAQRLWVVSLRDTIGINKTADERTHQLITKYNCPLVSYIYYPQSLDFLVYLCNLH